MLDRKQAERCDTKSDPAIPSKKKPPPMQSRVGEGLGQLARAAVLDESNSNILPTAVKKELLDAELPPL